MAQYKTLLESAAALIKGESDAVANMANLSALIYNNIPNLNWAGFYIFKNGQLVLGPFQGKPACIRLFLGKGVCGTAAQNKETLIVPDVHKFAGHIACDGASNSEIVVPIIRNDRLFGVLDIDSPLKERFGAEEKEFFEGIVKIFCKESDIGSF
jgi:GAF domain-containing protein